MASEATRKRKLRYELAFYWVVKDGQSGYIVELWRDPFSGEKLAETSIPRSTPQAAGRDARRYLRIAREAVGRIEGLR